MFDYIDGGADDEITMARNREAFLRWDLVPRVLRDVREVDLSTEILGTRISMPLICAPTGASRLFHHMGETAMARAVRDAGTIYTLSSVATRSIEDVAEVSDGPRWFQVYVWRDRAILRDFIDRARAAGYTALCLTVDVPVPGHRERDLRNGFAVPPRLRARNLLDALAHPRWLWHHLTSPRLSFRNVEGYAGTDAGMLSVMEYIARQFDLAVTWDDAARMIEAWQGPFVIKGILGVEDARRAAEIGASAIVVSNHGGRQLDGSPATLEVLPEIAEAVGDRVQVILDGGIRRGTDIIKALCLGARACMSGRALLYGLAAGGEAGAARALALLRAEMERDMRLLGCRSVAELGAGFLRRRD